MIDQKIFTNIFLTNFKISRRFCGPNKDSLQTKKIFAKNILCKEKDAKNAKKNIP